MDTIIEIGSHVPDFRLEDLSHRPHTLSEYRGRIVVLIFWSAECSQTLRVDMQMQAYWKDWEGKVFWISVASNKNETREQIAQVSNQRGLPIVLVDTDQVLADLFQAQITPHFFVIDDQGVLRYRGAFDDFTFRKRLPEHHYVYEAVQALLSGRLPDPADTPPYGCTIVRVEI